MKLLPRVRLMLAFTLVLLGFGLSGCGPDSALVEPEPTADSTRVAARQVVQIAMAFNTRCVLTAEQKVFCWGENRFGEFGNGSSASSASPVAGADGMDFMALFGSMGAARICGLQSGGAAWCWGYNLNGELGDGTTTHGLLPVPVSGGISFRAIATSYFTCGIDVGGVAYCWGSDLGGQLGNGAAGSTLTPQPVETQSRFVAITSGLQFACALETSGTAWCWGWGVGLGDGLSGDRNVQVPVAVAGQHRFASISAAEEHVCALTVSGEPYCWGKFGVNFPADFKSVPTPMPGDLTYTEIASGSGFSTPSACGITEDGTVYCWILGKEPQPLQGGHHFTGIVGNPEGFCGYTPSGSAYCWEWTVKRENGVDVPLIGWPQEIPPLP